MLIDASVARSFAVVGWSKHLITATGGTILIAQGVHSTSPEEPSELRRIRDALALQADRAGYGSGLASRALAAVHGLDELLALPGDQLVVLNLDGDEYGLAVRLQSRRTEDRQWRQSLGARSRRLDAGEAATIAIAASRSLPFASDDEDALVIWTAITGMAGYRSRDLLRRIVDVGGVPEHEARAVHRLLQIDDLHNLGGPPWEE